MHSGRGSSLLAILPLLLMACSAAPTSETQPFEDPALLQDIRQHCRNATGDERAYDELKAYISNDLPRCFMTHVNMEQMRVDMSMLETKDNGKLIEK